MNPIGYYSGTAQAAQYQAQWLTADFPCRQCGVNLRGQHIGGRCPQCGTPVGVSLYGNLLSYSDPGWLAKVRTGLLTILWTTIGMIVLGFGLGIVVGFVAAGESMRAQQSGRPLRPEDMPGLQSMAFVMGIVMLLGGLLMLYASWQVTTPDPTAGNDPRTATLRTLLRGSLIGALAVALLHIVLLVAKVQDSSAIGIVAQLLMSGLQVVVAISEGLYVSYLASRVPDAGLAGRARTAGWAMGIGIGVMALVQVLLVASGGASKFGTRNSVDSGVMAAGCVNGLIALAVLVFFIIFLVAMGQLAGKIRVARDYSMAVWAQPFGTQVPQAQPPMA
jgi:hypothetical protein